MGVAIDEDGEPLLVQAFFEGGRLLEVEWFKADGSAICSLPEPHVLTAYATLNDESLDLVIDPPSGEPMR